MSLISRIMKPLTSLPSFEMACKFSWEDGFCQIFKWVHDLEQMILTAVLCWTLSTQDLYQHGLVKILFLMLHIYHAFPLSCVQSIILCPVDF